MTPAGFSHDLDASVLLSATTGKRFASASLPVAVTSTRFYAVARWLGELLEAGLPHDDALIAALVRVRDDVELREACLALVRLAPRGGRHGYGKAVALGRFLGVPLPAWWWW